MEITTMPSMDILAGSLIFLGFVIFIIGGFWFLIAAFRESVLWGLACLFIPIVQLFFLIVHWPEARRPFFLQLLAFVMIIVGFIINPHALHH
jgi:polyferredoxin